MSLIVPYANTMAGAQQIVFDEGINIAPRHKTRRERVIELSRQWQIDEQRRQEAHQREQEAFREVIQRAKQKHRVERPHGAEDKGSHASEIIAMVAAWHGVEEQEIYSRSRVVKVIAARHDAIAAVYLNCRINGKRYSQPKLGRVFGIDPTSIYHALKMRGLK
ncbi:MAG: hypothetical protein WA973_06410 [Mesorhizobium sp.]